MALASITISSVRQEVIDFSIPYLDLGLTVLMKKNAPEKRFLAFMDPFTNDVWFMLFCSTMYVGLLLTICSTLSPYGYYGQRVQVNQDQLSMMSILSTLLSLYYSISVWELRGPMPEYRHFVLFLTPLFYLCIISTPLLVSIKHEFEILSNIKPLTVFP